MALGLCPPQFLNVLAVCAHGLVAWMGAWVHVSSAPHAPAAPISNTVIRAQILWGMTWEITTIQHSCQKIKEIKSWPGYKRQTSCWNITSNRHFQLVELSTLCAWAAPGTAKCSARSHRPLSIKRRYSLALCVVTSWQLLWQLPLRHWCWPAMAAIRAKYWRSYWFVHSLHKRALHELNWSFVCRKWGKGFFALQVKQWKQIWREGNCIILILLTEDVG